MRLPCSEDTPRSGALLDLREDNNVGVNSKRGLMLPRVSLEMYNTLDVLDLNFDIENPTINQKYDAKEHIGLTVFNTYEVAPLEGCNVQEAVSKEMLRGIYTWDGTQWSFIGQKNNGVGAEGVPKSWLAVGVDILYDIEGNSYFTMDYGSGAGVWMTQNMRAKSFDTQAVLRDGAGVVNPNLNGRKLNEGAGVFVSNRPTLEYAYPNEQGIYVPGVATNDDFYVENPSIGLLYSWGAVWGDQSLDTKMPVSSKRQGICPNGWHVPLVAEWSTLKDEIGTNPEKYSVPRADGTYPNTFTQLLQPCVVASGTGVFPSNFVALSLPVWKGGFAVNYMGYIHNAGNMAEPTQFNGSVFWTSDESVASIARPAVVYFTTNSMLTDPIPYGHWTRGNDAMTGVRCKKNGTGLIIDGI